MNAKFYEKNNIINVVGVLEHKIKNLYDLADILEKINYIENLYHLK